MHDISWVLPLRSGPATLLAEAITTFGYTGVVLAFVPVGYWLVDRPLFVRLALLVIVSATINGFLKDLFQDPRPPAYLALDQSEAGTYGLPSGHTQLATVLGGWLALTFRRRWLWMVASAAIVLMALSRLYIGVHDVEDVLGGFLVGVGVLVTAVTFAAFGAGPWQRLHPAAQIAILATTQGAIYLAWPHGEPGSRVAIGGLLIGWWAGVLAERRWVRFRRHPVWTRTLAASLAAMAFIYVGLRPIASSLSMLGVPQTAALWAQLFTIALFVSLIAPWIFVTVGLAVSEPRPRPS